MAELIPLKTLSDKKGNLTVLKDQLPFNIKRAFFIYGVDNSVRGGHKHKTTRQAAVCIHGKCIVSNNDGKNQNDFILDPPAKV